MEIFNRVTAAKVFGVILRQARLDATLSQEDLALDSGIDRTYVSMLERGLRVPTIVTLLQIAPSLKLQAFELMKRFETEMLIQQ